MNLPVLMTGQQRTDTLSCLGETACRMPDLDSVAAAAASGDAKAEFRGRLEARMSEAGDFHPGAPEGLVL